MSKLLLLILCCMPVPIPTTAPKEIVIHVKKKIDYYTLEEAYFDYISLLDNDCSEEECGHCSELLWEHV